MYPRSFLCEEAKIKQRTPLKKVLCEIGQEAIWESRFTSFCETDWVESTQCDYREILRWCDYGGLEQTKRWKGFYNWNKRFYSSSSVKLCFYWETLRWLDDLATTKIEIKEMKNNFSSP